MTEHSPSSKLPRVIFIVKRAQDGSTIRIRKFNDIADDLQGINRQRAKRKRFAALGSALPRNRLFVLQFINEGIQ